MDWNDEAKKIVLSEKNANFVVVVVVALERDFVCECCRTMT